MNLTFDQERIPLSVWPDGSVRVDGGRLHLAVVITAWNMGQSPEQIAANFPPLDLGDVYSIIGYYLRRKDGVDEYVRDWNEPWEQFVADTDAFEANEDYTFAQERIPLSVWPDGSVRVDGGRLHLAVVITAWNMGQSPEQIAANFSPLDLGDVYSIIGYYLHRKDEVDEYVRDWNEPWGQFVADTDAFEANEEYWQQLRIRAVEGGKLDDHPGILESVREQMERRRELLERRNGQA